jgi:beta-alanine--pyruvate transaminase
MGHSEFILRNQPAQKPLSLDELWMPFTPNRDFKSDPRIVVRAEGL